MAWNDRVEAEDDASRTFSAFEVKMVQKIVGSDRMSRGALPLHMIPLGERHIWQDDLQF